MKPKTKPVSFRLPAQIIIMLKSLKKYPGETTTATLTRIIFEEWTRRERVIKEMIKGVEAINGAEL